MGSDDDPEPPPSRADIAIRAGITASPRLGGSALILYEGIRDRRAARIAQVLDDASTGIEAAELERVLSVDERMDALLGQALQAAADSAVVAKRRLLGRLVNQAVLDDARVDESELFVRILSQIDAPHVRCLEAIHRAEQLAEARGEIPPRARGAERPLIRAIGAEGEKHPAPVLVALTSLGLLDSSGVDDDMYVKGVTSFGQRLLADLHMFED